MKIITYALIANVFFFLCEVFTVFYSGLPEHMDHFKYLFFGHDGHGVLVGWMWTSMALMFSAIGLLVFPKIRNNEKYMPYLCVMVFIGTWIDKGMGMIATGISQPSSARQASVYCWSITRGDCGQSKNE